MRTCWFSVTLGLAIGIVLMVVLMGCVSRETCREDFRTFLTDRKCM